MSDPSQAALLEEALTSLGEIEIGVLLSSVLWGCACVQAYIYATGPQMDRWFTKTFVALVVLLETVDVVMVWMWFYDMTVTQYGNPAAIHGFPKTFIAALAIHAWLAALVQAFFSYRIWRVSGKIYLALPAWIMIATRVGMTMAAGGLLELGPRGVGLVTTTDSWLVVVSLALSMTVDIWNTAALSYYLWSFKGNTFKRTSDVLSTIIRLTMETGVVIVVVAGLELVFWLVNPKSGLWIAALFVYARTYSNSLLVSLNARDLRKVKGDSTISGAGGAGIVLTRTHDVEMSGMGLGEDVPRHAVIQYQTDQISQMDSKGDMPFGDYK